MKAWIWLGGMISSISFAQITTTPNRINHLQFLYLSPEHHSGIFPHFNSQKRIGIYTQQLVSGTDLYEAQAWGEYQTAKQSHRFNASYLGSSDYANYSFQTAHFLKVHTHWDLGAGIDIQSNNLHNLNMGAQVYVARHQKNNHIQYRLEIQNQLWTHFIGWSQHQRHQVYGGFILSEGINYQAYAYVQTALLEGYEGIITIGTGSRRISILVSKNFNNLHLQLGGAWLLPINTISPFIQLYYEMQTRVRNRAVGYRLPSFNIPNS